MTEMQRRALELAKGLPSNANSLSNVAKETSEEASRWAFQQWSLRERARQKFRLADEMLFDRESLEMASHESVAAYHASRFDNGEMVADLTCGIGADLIAFASRGPAVGFELDPLRAEYARHNLEVHGLVADVVTADCLVSEWKADSAFCDPARRVGGRRTLNVSEFSPNPLVLAERFRELRRGGLKLSPMISDRELTSVGGSLEFLSFGGECREALVWFGTCEVTARKAVHIESGENLPAGADPRTTGSPASLLFEADPAAIRAHCLGELCSRHHLSGLGDSLGYLTGDSPVSSPWLRAFEVLAFHRADTKRTATELRRLGGGTPVVKSRGTIVDVEKLRKDLRGEGEPLVVVVYPVGRSIRHAICRAC